MRKQLMLLLMTGLLCVSPGPMLLAQDGEASDTQAVVERANNLKNLLDRLLAQSNHSSIQKLLHEGGDSSDPLVAEALRLKASGEQYLAEENYLKAAMTLQSALDHVFQAIRSQHAFPENGKDSNTRLQEAIATNDTFIAAATRVVNGQPKGEAVELLASARDARAQADASVADGDTDTALTKVENSTQLAQQAIRSVRNGMVIERGQ